MASNNMKSRYLLEHLTLSTSQLLCQVNSIITKPRDAALPFRYHSQYSSTDCWQIISEMLQLFTILLVSPLLIHLHSFGRKKKSALTCLFSPQCLLKQLQTGFEDCKQNQLTLVISTWLDFMLIPISIPLQSS